MNLAFPNKWSERQQVAAIIIGMGVLLFVLWFFLLLPVNRQRHRLENDIASMTDELAGRNYLLGEDALQRRLDDESMRFSRLTNDWQGTVFQLGSFAADEISASGGVAVIDFKVALFNVRQRLLRKSAELQVGLPRDLNVDEAVESNEDPYQRMLQLRVLEKLVDLSLDLKIKTVREIRTLPPITHRAGPQQVDFFTEYPLELELYGTLDNLYELLGVVMEPAHVFVLRGLRVEPASANRADLLNIKAVMSAMVFLKQPAEIGRAPERSPTTRRRALGH